jgi:membrane peptidoglycan carboxypeptidase
MHSAPGVRKVTELVSVKWKYIRIMTVAAGCVTLVTLLGAYALACAYLYLVPTLPSTEAMRNAELQVPLRVFTRSGELIAQIGEQRRIPVSYAEIPDLVKHAFVAAEDERFFEHHGIDYFGVIRAAVVDVVSGHKTQGASTITMQAARNMFLSLDKTARRKLQETFVTYRMEHEFSKQEIFGLYLNVIFFGQRAYGVAAASEAFFGKTLDKLDVAEAATLAGVPKAPPPPRPPTRSRCRRARTRRCSTSRRRTSPRWRASSSGSASVRVPRPRATRCTRRSTGACRPRRCARCASGSSSTTAATAGAEPRGMSSCQRAEHRTTTTWSMSTPRSAICRPRS